MISFKGAAILQDIVRRFRLFGLGKVAFFLLALNPAWTFAAKQESTSFSTPAYPGLSSEQVRLAQAALIRFYNGDMKSSEHLLERMDPLETQNSLPPLSRLLWVATKVMRLQRGDAKNPQEAEMLENIVRQAGEEGIEKCDAILAKGTQPTCLLIQGGIQGFTASLKLSVNPTKTLHEGLKALKKLERLLVEYPQIKDANMGVGIFQCTASNSSLIVRATLKMLGRSFSFAKGNAFLRQSAYSGLFTKVSSQFYLIQFLSPYTEELRQEKEQIFLSLESQFPESAYPTFLHGEEALCFYPDTFYLASWQSYWKRGIRSSNPRDDAERRYHALARYQYSLIHPSPRNLRPDTTVDLGGFAYYPLFIQALKIRKNLMDFAGDEQSRTNEQKKIKRLKDSILTILEESDFSISNQKIYAWHVHDALNTRHWKKKRLVTSGTVSQSNDSDEVQLPKNEALSN